MTDVFGTSDSCAIDITHDSKSGPTSPTNSFRRHFKHHSLSRNEILLILQDLVFEGALVDYMVAHGAISTSSAKELMHADCKNEQKGEKLLDLLISEYATPQNYSQNAKLALLTNALRSTGQHALASQLDRGRKIKPAPITAAKPIDTGYGSDIDPSGDPPSSNLRRRGQLSLWVQVAAIRLTPTSSHQRPPSSWCPSSSPSQGERHLPAGPSLNGHDFEEAGNTVKNLLETSKGAYFWIDLRGSSIACTEFTKSPTLSALTTADSCVTWQPKSKMSFISDLLACLCCASRRRRNSSEAEKDGPSDDLNPCFPSMVHPSFSNTTPHIQPLTDSGVCDQERALRLAKLAILDAKSNDFYVALANPLSDALVKFLEQALGVLVLGARVEPHCPDNCLPKDLIQPLSSAVVVSIVATTHEVLQRLHDAVKLKSLTNSPLLPPASSLSSALEAIFQQEMGFLEKIDIRDIRLSVTLQADEMRLAATELEE